MSAARIAAERRLHARSPSAGTLARNPGPAPRWHRHREVLCSKCGGRRPEAMLDDLQSFFEFERRAASELMRCPLWHAYFAQGCGQVLRICGSEAKGQPPLVLASRVRSGSSRLGDRRARSASCPSSAWAAALYSQYAGDPCRFVTLCSVARASWYRWTKK